MPSISMPSMPSLPSLGSVPGLNRIPGMRRRRWGPQGSSGAPQTASHVDPGFANPMYDNTPLDDDFVMKEMEMIGSIREEQPTFEASSKGFQNPLYGKPKTSGFKDPSKVDTPGDEATVSGVATTPSSGAAHDSSSSKDKASSKRSAAAAQSTDTDAANIILDFSDTAALNSDSTI
ncbi:hypothetical protein ElyMa_002000800 [Elysia marginata]|uniref:Uncharacterized protein n=1 Tax=Elysia marginata TaxID=1093978 RepID=A0AAV4F3E5_9GAST|nr:hypothetical protein ElyMa_002000800 [Elysia marginata]